MSEDIGFPPLPPVPGMSYTGKLHCTTCHREILVFHQKVDDMHSVFLEMCPWCQAERAKRDPVSGV